MIFRRTKVHFLKLGRMQLAQSPFFFFFSFKGKAESSSSSYLPSACLLVRLLFTQLAALTKKSALCGR
jgi:hypothetical protein